MPGDERTGSKRRRRAPAPATALGWLLAAATVQAAVAAGVEPPPSTVHETAATSEAAPVPAAATPPVAPAPPAGAIPSDAAAVAVGGAVEDGVWLRREVQFWYHGLTSYYSCESLADKLRDLLIAAGAREDARATPRSCGFGSYQVTNFPSAQLVFYTLVPASQVPPPPPPKPSAPAKQLGRDAPKLPRKDPMDPQPGVGAWRTVVLDGRKSRSVVDAGDCELVEQFVKRVLPEFTTRNVVNDLHCVPRNVSPWDVKLSFDVLGPLPKADVGRAKKK